MKRNRLLASATMTAALLAQSGIALADDVAPSPAAASDATPPANTAPVAVDDTGVSVGANSSVAVEVLANDTDDGLGRPDGQTPHLEIATFGTWDGRVSTDPTRTKLTFTARSTDPGKSFEVAYTATDGTLSSVPAKVVVTVAAVPTPVTRKVSLTTVSGVVALRSYSLHGSVSPIAPGPAKVVVQRLVGGSWTTFKSDQADSHGAYGVRFSTVRPKRYVFRAVATWTNGKRATSGPLVRTVVARPDVHVSGPLTRGSVPYSYRSGCPVRPSGLRKIWINRFTYSHVVARGSLVVRASAVPDILRVFKASFASRFAVRSMKPSDVFYARGSRTPTQSDLAAMRADNTSAFNCRPVTGNPFRVSQHSYGNAIDINTVRNPYVVGSRVYPSFARTYLHRSDVRTGMIMRSGVIASTMRRNGWPWGARWAHPDYQHFSSNGG